MSTRTNRLPLLAGAAAAALIAFTAPVAAIAQQRTIVFDIPEQDLDGALKAVARASGEQIVYQGDTVRGKRRRQ